MPFPIPLTGSRKARNWAPACPIAESLFPSSVLEMISVAEESGKLDQELVRIAGVTEGDLDRNLKTAVAFLEPVMLFCHRRVCRHNFHRHDLSDLCHARLHQIDERKTL